MLAGMQCQASCTTVIDAGLTSILAALTSPGFWMMGSAASACARGCPSRAIGAGGRAPGGHTGHPARRTASTYRA